MEGIAWESLSYFTNHKLLLLTQPTHPPSLDIHLRRLPPRIHLTRGRLSIRVQFSDTISIGLVITIGGMVLVIELAIIEARSYRSVFAHKFDLRTFEVLPTVVEPLDDADDDDDEEGYDAVI